MSDDDLIRRWQARDLLDSIAAGDEYLADRDRLVAEIPAAPLDALTLERAAQVAEANAPKECDRDDVSLGASAAAHGIARDIRALAPEPAHVTAARVVKIKPLEWEAVEEDRGDGSSDLTGDWIAHTPFGSYSIVVGFGSGYYVFDLYFGEMDLISSHDDPELAKAAAQADYEARIRSAIVGDQPTEPAEVTAARMLLDRLEREIARHFEEDNLHSAEDRMRISARSFLRTIVGAGK